jgi:hypothetical protein
LVARRAAPRDRARRDQQRHRLAHRPAAVVRRGHSATG